MPAYPTGGKATSLGQFVDEATKFHGCRLLQLDVNIRTSDGEFSPRYLVAEDGRRVRLPQFDDDVLLSIQIIKQMCSRLGISTIHFIPNDPIQ